MSKATLRQKSYIRSLYEKLPLYNSYEDMVTEGNIEKLSIKEASMLIDDLLDEIYCEDNEGWDDHK